MRQLCVLDHGGSHCSVGFQHAAELLRLAAQNDLHTLRGADIFTIFCAPPSLTNISQKPLRSAHNIFMLRGMFEERASKISFLNIYERIVRLFQKRDAKAKHFTTQNIPSNIWLLTS